MKVELRLYASLGKYMPEQRSGPSESMEVAEGSTIRAVLERLNVPLDSVKIIFLNGLHASGDEALKNGDRVGVFPPVAGG
ncbi:MAG: MoaD/ThiS family protein [Desulfobacteraceae bacterium]|nr:MAG: MoaD/ThiS family protein [Desulfobacteraceae bacterium]